MEQQESVTKIRKLLIEYLLTLLEEKNTSPEMVLAIIELASKLGF